MEGIQSVNERQSEGRLKDTELGFLRELELFHTTTWFFYMRFPLVGPCERSGFKGLVPTDLRSWILNLLKPRSHSPLRG